MAVHPDTLTRLETLYDALNRRDLGGMVGVCHPEVELEFVTGRMAGRTVPYRGHEGVRRYLQDVGRLWDELLVTPRHMAERGDELVVWGRVYARSRDLGVRDLPAVWVWRERDRLISFGRVHDDAPDELRSYRRTDVFPTPGVGRTTLESVETAQRDVPHGVHEAQAES